MNVTLKDNDILKNSFREKLSYNLKSKFELNNKRIILNQNLVQEIHRILIYINSI